MLNPNSLFRYNLLEQEEPRNEEMDLKYLEKQYRQNITFIESQITEIESKIAIIKADKVRCVEHEGCIQREIVRAYEKMEIYNPYAENSKISWLKKLLKINSDDLIHLTKVHLYLVNLLVDTIANKDENEDGLNNIKTQFENLQREKMAGEDESNLYQPPRL